MTQDQKEAKHTYWRGIMDKWSASVAADLKMKPTTGPIPVKKNEEERGK